MPRKSKYYTEWAILDGMMDKQNYGSIYTRNIKTNNFNPQIVDLFQSCKSLYSIADVLTSHVG